MKTTQYIYNMQAKSFLTQTIRQVRKSIKDIDDSYNNEWDILSELTQNSVDAIKKRIQKKEIGTGEIKLLIDCRNNFISIQDNGVGIAPNDLEYLLAPFSTDKENDESSIGEKGVGLTFAIFSCNQFYIKSGNENGTAEGKINDAYKWKLSTHTEDLLLLREDLTEPFAGTLIELGHIKTNTLFELSLSQLKAVLRTKTALGNTLRIWTEDIDIKIDLTYISKDGATVNEPLDFNYLLLTEGRKKSSMISMEDWYAFAGAGKTDNEKRRKLHGKIVYKKGLYPYGGNRVIRYWACCVSSRPMFNEISIKNDICTTEQLRDDNFLEQKGFTLFQPAITVSVKGMPTGITIEHPVTGEQGRWPQLFMIFEDSQIKFDIGRKSIHGMQAKIFKGIAREIFNEFVRNVTKYMGEEDEKVKPQWDKNQIFAGIKALPSIGIDNIRLQKQPIDQEASVVGLFYECIGNRLIKDILPLSSGYKKKYDLYALWGVNPVVIEFKAKLLDIIEDWENEKKWFNELDCVVCWGVNAEDFEEFNKAGLTLEAIEEKEFGGLPHDLFPHATHQIILPYVSPLNVIDLSLIIKQDG
jgi:hypothetical protein